MQYDPKFPVSLGHIVFFKHNDQTALEAGGNCYPGTVVPAIVVAVWNANDGYVNLKLLNDSGKDTWVTSVTPGESQRQWSWPSQTRLV